MSPITMYEIHWSDKILPVKVVGLTKCFATVEREWMGKVHTTNEKIEGKLFHSKAAAIDYLVRQYTNQLETAKKTVERYQAKLEELAKESREDPQT